MNLFCRVCKPFFFYLAFAHLSSLVCGSSLQIPSVPGKPGGSSAQNAWLSFVPFCLCTQCSLCFHLSSLTFPVKAFAPPSLPVISVSARRCDLSSRLLCTTTPVYDSIKQGQQCFIDAVGNVGSGGAGGTPFYCASHFWHSEQNPALCFKWVSDCFCNCRLHLICAHKLPLFKIPQKESRGWGSRLNKTGKVLIIIEGGW